MSDIGEQGSSKKFDPKSATISGISVAALLTILQSQGITFMNKSQEEKNAVVIQKTLENRLNLDAQSKRIDKIEKSIESIERQIREGFEASSRDLKREAEKISDIVRIMAGDRYTKSEHNSYAQSINDRLNRLEDRLRELQKHRND